MKQIVFVHGGDIMKKKIPVSEKNSESYQLLFSMAKAQGLHMMWSSLKYFKNKKFKKHSYFNGKKWKKVRKWVRPDFIVEKSKFRYVDVGIKRKMAMASPYLNPLQLQFIASDKLLTYFTFPEIVYRSTAIQSKRDINKALARTQKGIYVVKPLYGAGGKSVEFLNKSEVEDLEITEPLLMQRSVDCEKGIPGIYKGVHDFRLLFLENKLIHSYYRTAAPGTKLCNVSLGGQRVVVPLTKIPIKLKKMAKVVQERFSQFPNSFYSIDFIYEKGRGPKIIEINSTPGLDNAPGYDKHLEKLYSKLIKHISKYSH